jgi:hypothetical protein
MFDMPGLSLMSAEGFNSVLTNPQRHCARGFAMGTAPNARVAGLKCPPVPPPPPSQDFGTSPAEARQHRLRLRGGSR